MSNRAIKQLSADHQLILEALDTLRVVTDRIKQHEIVELQDIALLLEFFRKFVHEYHDGKEESVLIPSLLQTGKTLHDGAVNRIIADHREIHSLVPALESALAAGSDAEFFKVSERYSQLLTDHIFNEDRVLFDAMSQGLDDVTDHRIAKEFSEFDPGLGARSKAKFESLAKTLNRKYWSPTNV